MIFGWGRTSILLGTAGTRPCSTCMDHRPIRATLEYRYFHVLWLFGPILTRRYLFDCPRCGTAFDGRSPRLTKIVTVGRTRLLSLGPFFFIFLGGALVLLGPGDFRD